MNDSVVVVDYGSGNVRSMVNALRKAAPEVSVQLTKEPAEIAGAGRLVVPGVGAFAEVKRKVEASGLVDVLDDFRKTGRPILGVCVGMQILADHGEEFESTAGLGWVRGTVRQLRVANEKLPHFGWSGITPTRPSPILEGIPAGSQFYFVHSFVLDGSTHDVAATASYGETFTAAIQFENVFATQFHPEKSDRNGLALLRNFVQWNPS